MNILFFCSNPVDGGTARVFYELVTAVKSILPKGDKLSVCVNQENPVKIYKKIENINRLPVYSEEEICLEMYGGSIVKRLWKRICRKIKYYPVKRRNIALMKEYLKCNCIDAVIIHNGGYVGDDLCNQMLTAAYRCAEHIVHRIYVLHSDMEKNIYLKLRFWPYDKKISREATKIVTVSEFTRNRMLSSSFINQEIEVIYNGMSDIHQQTEEEQHKLISVNPKEINVLMIGNFQDNKGQYQFLEAADRLYRGNKDYHFTIIGNIYDKNYFKKCQDLIKTFGLEQGVSVYHRIYHASEFIKLFDILVVPSMYDESFGLISIEAMENRRPVVAFACGGIPEVVSDGRTGFIVPVGDVKLLAERVEWLAVHPDERKAMGEQGRKYYEERFSVETMANKYLKLLGEG